MWIAGFCFGLSAIRSPSSPPSATRISLAVLRRHLRQRRGSMLNLAEYRHEPDRLADHLPWAALSPPASS